MKKRTAKGRFSRACKMLSQWCRKARHLPVEEQHRQMERKLRGHYAYYGVTGNGQALGRFRFRAERIWRYWLSRRSQRARLSWDRFKRLLARYPLPPPVVVHSVYRRAAKPCPRGAGCVSAHVRIRGSPGRATAWGHLTGERDRAIFRGGTALHKLFFGASGRYSEDIDLVQRDAGPIGELITAIRDSPDPWLGNPTTRPFVVDNPWFSGTANLTVVHLDELLGTKLRALYQRKKGRDLFDLWLALRAGEAHPERVIECFQQYMAHDGVTVSRAEFEASLAAKLESVAFVEDLRLLVPAEVEDDPVLAAQVVRGELIARLPGAPWGGGGP